MSNILIVDDDKHFCHLSEDQVSKLGHSAVYAHTLQAAMERSRENDFDVVLLDVGLPDGDGLKMLFPGFRRCLAALR